MIGWRDGFAVLRFEACRLEPALHLAIGKAQPAMGEIIAQELEVMRREIGDGQPPARPHHPRRLGNRGARIVEIMQHLMEQYRVKASIPRGTFDTNAESASGTDSPTPSFTASGAQRYSRSHTEPSLAL